VVDTNYEEISIANLKFKITAQAKFKLQNYLDILDGKLKKQGIQDTIEDMHTRIAEHFALLSKTIPNQILTQDEVSYVMKKIGGLEDIDQMNADLPKTKKKLTFKQLMKKILKITGYIVFWVPHIIWGIFALIAAVTFLAFIVAGPENLTLGVLATYLGALLLPTVGIVVGVLLTIKKKLKAMYLFLLGIEIPLFLLSIFRIAALRIISPALSFLYILILLSCLVLLLDIFGFKKKNWLSKAFEYDKIIGYSAGTLVSGYILTIWSFFFPIMLNVLYTAIHNFVQEFTQFQTSFNPYRDGFFFMQVWQVPLLLSGFLIFLLFYLSPVYAFVIYFSRLIKQLKVVFSSLRKSNSANVIKFEKQGMTFANISKLAVCAFTFVAIPTVLFILSFQPSYRLQGDIENTTTQEEGFEKLKGSYLELYQNEALAKRILRNKLLSKYRFLVDEDKEGMFDDLYCNKPSRNSYRNYRDPGFTFDQSFCDSFEKVFSTVIFPVIYQGDMNSDFKNAQIEYKKIFDDSIQRGEKKTIKKYTANTLGESVFTFRGDDEIGLLDEDEKRVDLRRVDVETEINVDLNMHKTTYTLTFNNKEVTNQEVYLEFSLPEYSVMSDLKLGPNLENQGVVAPKAAAHLVYEQSLRRSIDPALLELISPNTYRLRVYPIPPRDGDEIQNWNSRTDESEITIIPNYQRVQFTYTGLIVDEYELLTFDYTRNIDISRNVLDFKLTNIEGANPSKIETILNSAKGSAAKYLKESKYLSDIKYKDDKSFAKESILSYSGFGNQCTQEELSNEAILYFDVSRSANRKDQKEIYKEIIREFAKEYDVRTFQFREFNFDVNKVNGQMSLEQVGVWIDKLEFWGYSDKSEIIKSILADARENQDANILILSDDSDFEFTEKSNYDISYKDLQDQRIFLLQIGERQTAQKEEINNLVWASGGDSFLVKPDLSNLESQISKIGLECLDVYENAGFDNIRWSDVYSKLATFEENKGNLKNISSADSRIRIATENFVRSKKASIMDPFTSMIALETSWQKQQLERESSGKDAFDLEHDIGEKGLIVPSASMFGSSMPELDQTTTIIIILFTGVGLVLFRKYRHHKRLNNLLK
jgi:hypothetical protein